MDPIDRVVLKIGHILLECREGGQKVAEVGVEGNSGGPHVHVEGQRTKFWKPNGGTRLEAFFRV